METELTTAIGHWTYIVNFIETETINSGTFGNFFFFFFSKSYHFLLHDQTTNKDDDIDIKISPQSRV